MTALYNDTADDITSVPTASSTILQSQMKLFDYFVFMIP